MTIGSGTSHTLRAIVTPLRKWLSPLLVLRGALRNGLVPTCSVNFDACEWREASLSTGVRCDNPIPHDFMRTLRCVSPVGGTHIFWFTCLGFAVSLDTSRIFGSWSRRAVFAISSTFTTAPSASICVLCGSRVFHVPFVFGPYQRARTGVLMRLSDLRITLYASWSSILAFSLRRKAPSKGNTANRRSIFPIRQGESTIDLARSS